MSHKFSQEFYSKNLNINFTTIDCPEKNLPNKDYFVEEISELVSSSWGYYDKDKIKNVFLKLDQIILGRKGKELCFITGGKWKKIIYEGKYYMVYRVGLTVVRKYSANGEYLWNRGLMSLGTLILIKKAAMIRFLSPFYICLRTLEPVIFHYITKKLNYVLPDINRKKFPTQIEKKIILEMSREINPDCDVDIDKLVIKGAFKNNLKLAKEKLKHLDNFDDENIKTFFKENIDYNRGDAFLVLAKLTLWELFCGQIFWYIKDRKL
ncbi:MAG: hypothetical protein NC820_06280 [Candidatus Omnitrophica bacterium]|nr:hypothetical protein [Candidatus Omnitrophota bacterium]